MNRAGAPARSLGGEDERVRVQVVDRFTLRLGVAEGTSSSQIAPAALAAVVHKPVEIDLVIRPNGQRRTVGRHRRSRDETADFLIGQNAGVAARMRREGLT